MSDQPVILIDADFLVYSAGFAAQHTEYLCTTSDGHLLLGRARNMAEYQKVIEEAERNGELGEEDEPIRWERTTVEPVANCLHSCKLMIQRMIDDIRERMEWFDPRVEVYLTGTGNFREKIATIKPYKGNRPPWSRPRLYRELREYLRETWQAQVVHDMEADDMVAIRLTEEPLGNAVLAGIDKDLLQVPGLHYNPNKGMLKVSKKKGLLKLYRQILSGDATDNIGGVYKLGEAAARKLLPMPMPEQEMWDIVVQAYAQSIERYAEKTGYAHMSAREAAEENAQLIYMLRHREDKFVPPDEREVLI